MAEQGVMATLEVNLDALLRSGTFDIGEVARVLEGLSAPQRLTAVRSLSGAAQAKLYEAAKGVRKLALDELVPAATEPLVGVVHEGKNSLPLFTHFAKVFCRPRADARELWGYNRSGSFVQTVVGPGYFVVYEGPGDELLIDYARLPSGKPPGWPEVIGNGERLSRFVYAGMIDALRGVSSHVSVGRAIRNGKVQDNWFVLCRQ